MQKKATQNSFTVTLVKTDKYRCKRKACRDINRKHTSAVTSWTRLPIGDSHSVLSYCQQKHPVQAIEELESLKAGQQAAEWAAKLLVCMIWAESMTIGRP